MFNGHGNTVNKKGTGDFKANNEIIELQYYNIHTVETNYESCDLKKCKKVFLFINNYERKGRAENSRKRVKT